jgi:hypothetical protein
MFAISEGSLGKREIKKGSGRLENFIGFWGQLAPESSIFEIHNFLHEKIQTHHNSTPRALPLSA